MSLISQTVLKVSFMPCIGEKRLLYLKYSLAEVVMYTLNTL